MYEDILVSGDTSMSYILCNMIVFGVIISLCDTMFVNEVCDCLYFMTPWLSVLCDNRVVLLFCDSLFVFLLCVTMFVLCDRLSVHVVTPFSNLYFVTPELSSWQVIFAY